MKKRSNLLKNPTELQFSASQTEWVKVKVSYLSKELQALQPPCQPEVVQCPGHPRTPTR